MDRNDELHLTDPDLDLRWLDVQGDDTHFLWKRHLEFLSKEIKYWDEATTRYVVKCGLSIVVAAKEYSIQVSKASMTSATVGADRSRREVSMPPVLSSGLVRPVQSNKHRVSNSAPSFLKVFCGMSELSAQGRGEPEISKLGRGK